MVEAGDWNGRKNGNLPDGNPGKTQQSAQLFSHLSL